MRLYGLSVVSDDTYSYLYGHCYRQFAVAPRKPAAAVTHWDRWGDKRR